MWGAKDSSLGCCLIISPIKILWESLKIINTNKLLFCSIFILTSLPLSFLTLTLTVSTHARVVHVNHLEAVARVAPTRVEARHVWHESRVEAISLFRTRALFAVLCFPISLAAAVASVQATASASTVCSAVRTADSWKRPAVTVIFVYCILLAFAPVPRVLALAFGSSHLTRVMVRVVGTGIEIYLFAVMSLGLVVSVTEDRVGWEAIRVGSGLMRGKTFCGWVISGLFVLVSGFINKKVQVLLEKNRNNSEIIEISVWDERVLVMTCCYALVVLASYVVTTVFYCDGRRRHDIKVQQQPNHDDEDSVQVSSSL